MQVHLTEALGWPSFLGLRALHPGRCSALSKRGARGDTTLGDSWFIPESLLETGGLAQRL